MNCNWNKIGEGIGLLYKEMEYRSGYSLEDFHYDLIIEKKKEKLSIIGRYSNTELQNNTEWISVLRNTFESRRSILTKLFSFTNNPNGVDILIEYCDYYKSYYDVDLLRNNIHAVTLPELERMFHSVFVMMAKNEITENVIEHVWELIQSDTGLCSSFPDHSLASGFLAMVIMADSDLNAAVLALARTRHTYFEVSRVLVQEPIKEQLLRTIKNYECEVEIPPNYLYVFHNTAEALGYLNGKNEFKAVSVWSENVIAAKKFSANTEIDTIWINAHGALGAGLNSMIYESNLFPRSLSGFWNLDLEEDYKVQKTPKEISRTYDLFYGGKWQSPVDGRYWINQIGVAFAEATEKDARNCANAARGAFKIWRSKKSSQRANIIRSFADRLQANGEFEYADIVSRLVNRALGYGTSAAIVRDGEAEIITTSKPVGVVAIASNDLKTLFEKLTIAVVAGNAVIVLLNSRSSISFASYCDLIGTCGFPPGVINCLFTSDPINYEFNEELIDAVLSEYSGSPFSEFYKSAEDKIRGNILYDKLFAFVTRPKSVWLQCA